MKQTHIKAVALLRGKRPLATMSPPSNAWKRALVLLPPISGTD